MKAQRFKYCPVCECGFFYRRESAKFCSPACKQKAHRIAHGQTVARSEAARRTVEELSSKALCPHCLKSFWQNTRGRKRVFCSNSCRVSAHRLKIAAAWRLVKWLNKVNDYQALALVDSIGTGGVDELALQHGCKYSYTTRTYTGMTPDFWQNSHA